MEFNKHSGNYVDRSFSSFDRQGKKTIIVDGCSMAGEFLGPICEPQDKKERDRFEGGDIGINLSERFGFNHVGLNFVAKSNCSILEIQQIFYLISVERESFPMKIYYWLCRGLDWQDTRILIEKRWRGKYIIYGNLM